MRQVLIRSNCPRLCWPLWFHSWMTEIDPEVVAFYEQGLEVDRLSAQHPFEFVRTIDILERVLPAAPVDVLDVGGGPGRYSAWLCERGDRVELIDPIPLHVEQALALDVAGLRARLGDSRELSVEDGSVDVVLLMGPLYHLIDPADRRQSLRECLRVLRPGGRVVATAITRWAPLFGILPSPSRLARRGQRRRLRQRTTVRC